MLILLTAGFQFTETMIVKKDSPLFSIYSGANPVTLFHRLCPGHPRVMGRKNGYFEGEVPLNPETDWMSMLVHTHGIGGGEGAPDGAMCPFGFFRRMLGPLAWDSNPFQTDLLMVRILSCKCRFGLVFL